MNVAVEPTRTRTSPNRIIRALSAAGMLMLIAQSGAASDRDDDKWVIPPGRESLLGKILGAGQQLPGNCRLVNGDIQFSVITATYDCDGSQVVLQFAHPDQAGAEPAITTKRFAIESKGETAPQDLLRALEDQVKEREEQFAWEPAPLSGPPKEEPIEALLPEGPLRYVLGAAALLAIGVLGFILRRA